MKMIEMYVMKKSTTSLESDEKEVICINAKYCVYCNKYYKIRDMYKPFIL